MTLMGPQTAYDVRTPCFMFSHFAYFSYTKRITVPFCMRATAQGLHGYTTEYFQFQLFHFVVEGPMG